MRLDAAKPSIPLVICMFFKDSLFKPMQSYDCVTELVIFFNGISKFFTANPAWIQGKSQQDSPVCHVFTCKAKVSEEEKERWKL